MTAFLQCGDLHQGFARVRCPDCHHEMFVAFSCKQRYTLVTCGAFTPEGEFLELPELDLDRLRATWREAVFALYLAEDKIEPEVVENMRTWPHSGFSVDQSVLLAAGDQAGIERLVQYMTRCPFSLARLVKVSESGQVVYKAEKASCRSFPDPRGDGMQAGPKRNYQHAIVDTEEESLSRSSQSWAMLIKRVYELDPLTCPECGGQMAVVAFIEPPQAEVIEKILRHCGLWRSSAARAPPANANGDAIDRARRSDSEPNELTYVDMDTFLATF